MKKYLRFIVPLLVVVLIIVLAVISKFNQKPSGKDLYISFEEESTSDDDKYIEGVYESVVKPNYTIKEDDSGNKTVVTDSDEVSINEKDKEILVKDEDGNIEVVKISDLLGDNEPTNNNVAPSEKQLDSTNAISVLVSDGLGGSYYMLVPKEVAYDTVLVKRGDNYVGVLYGKYLYKIPSSIVETYNIDSTMIIASYNTDLLLGNDTNNVEFWLESGQITEKGNLGNGGDE